MFGQDFEEDLRVADSTDILLGVHGAGLNNLIFLRPGSNVVELRPCDSPEFLANHFQLMTWQLNFLIKHWTVRFEAQDLCLPGHLERQGIGRKDLYGRDRSVHLPLEGFRFLVERIFRLEEEYHLMALLRGDHIVRILFFEDESVALLPTRTIFVDSHELDYHVTV